MTRTTTLIAEPGDRVEVQVTNAYGWEPAVVRVVHIKLFMGWRAGSLEDDPKVCAGITYDVELDRRGLHKRHVVNIRKPEQP